MPGRQGEVEREWRQRKEREGALTYFEWEILIRHLNQRWGGGAVERGEERKEKSEMIEAASRKTIFKFNRGGLVALRRAFLSHSDPLLKGIIEALRNFQRPH